jgi:hypothetical protein
MQSYAHRNLHLIYTVFQLYSLLRIIWINWPAKMAEIILLRQEIQIFVLFPPFLVLGSHYFENCSDRTFYIIFMPSFNQPCAPDRIPTKCSLLSLSPQDGGARSADSTADSQRARQVMHNSVEPP